MGHSLLFNTEIRQLADEADVRGGVRFVYVHARPHSDTLRFVPLAVVVSVVVSGVCAVVEVWLRFVPLAVVVPGVCAVVEVWLRFVPLAVLVSGVCAVVEVWVELWPGCCPPCAAASTFSVATTFGTASGFILFFAVPMLPVLTEMG